MCGQDPYITPPRPTSVIYTFIFILSDTDSLIFTIHCSHSLCVCVFVCECASERVCSPSVLQAFLPQGSLSLCLCVKWRQVLLASRPPKCTINGFHIHIKQQGADASRAGGGEFECPSSMCSLATLKEW